MSNQCICPHLKYFINKRLTIFLQHRVATKLKFVQNINICKDHYNKVYLHFTCLLCACHSALIPNLHQSNKKCTTEPQQSGESSSLRETTDQAQIGLCQTPKTHAPAGCTPWGHLRHFTVTEGLPMAHPCSRATVPTHPGPRASHRSKHHWGSKDLLYYVCCFHWVYHIRN